MNKIKKGDQVIVIAGKDKGKQGTVQTVLGDYAVVDGVNLKKKHQKPNPQKQKQGGIEEKAYKLHISNIAIFNPNSKKADRVGIKMHNDKKVRYYKSSKELIEG